MSAGERAEFFDSCPGLLFIAAHDGRLQHCNAALIERFGEAPTLAALLDEGDGEGRRALEGFLAERATSDGDGSLNLVAIDTTGARQEVRIVARRSASGAIHGRLEPLAPRRDDPSFEGPLLRCLMRSLEIAVWVVDRDGTFVFHDGKALASAGMEPGQLLGANVFDLYPDDASTQINAALAGTSSRQRTVAHDVHWETWTLPLRDDTGTPTHVIGVSLDVTSQSESERELERQLETIKDQQRAILELSAPLINVWDRVVTVPLIGSMDSERTDELSERLLAEVHRARTRFAILDLTGVEAVDTSIASHILRLLQSMRLLGVEGLVTGVSPEVAQTMVGVGIDFEGVQTYRSLREGLRYCMRALMRERA